MEDFIDFVGGPPPLGDISFLFCSTYFEVREKEWRDIIVSASAGVDGDSDNNQISYTVSHVYENPHLAGEWRTVSMIITSQEQ